MNFLLTYFNHILNLLASNPFYIYGILVAAIIFTIITKGIQFRYFFDGWKLMFRKNDDKEGVSSFRTAMLSIAGRVGTGNVAGVAVAVIMGGAGAVFWMWVVAILGMATSFIESTLGQYHKEKNSEHVYVGGPSYYIEQESKGKLKWIAIIYSVVMIVSKGLFVLSIQASTIFNSTYEAFAIDRYSFWGIAIVGVILILVIYAILGGMTKLMQILSIIVPAMTLGYLCLVLIVMAMNIDFIPIYFKLVLTQAFKPIAIFGGGIGVAISSGVKRGIFSNEAGQGTGAIAGASGGGKHPVEQGLVQMITVFVDTIVVCSLSSFVIILAFFKTNKSFFKDYQLAQGYETIEAAFKGAQSNISGGALATMAFDSAISYGGKLVALFLFFFAFSSILALIAYGMQSIKYLFKNRSFKFNNIAIKIYGLVTILMIISTPLLDALAEKNSNFNLFMMGDNLISLLFYINIIAMLILLPKSIKLLKDYDKKRKSNLPMSFAAKDIDEDIKTSSWN